MTQRRHSKHLKTWAPAGTFVAVLAIAGGAALLSSGPDAPPRQLSLASPREAATSLSAGDGSYELTGTLPQGTPADAAAWSLPGGLVDADLVASLAKALGAPAPVRDGKAWRAGGLQVSGDSGQVWWYSSCVVDQPVSSDPGVRIGCAIAGEGAGVAPGSTGGTTSSGSISPDPDSSDPDSSGSGSSGSGSSGSDSPAPPATASPYPMPGVEPSPAPEPPPLPEQAVREAARPVFDALGLDVGRARIESSSYSGSAVLDSRVGGQDVVGLSTRVEVDPQGEIRSANGWLATPRMADSYPLISAQQAFDALPEQPRMLACPISPSGEGCLEPPKVKITGAHLGLSLQQLTSGEGMLLPSWLFDVSGSAEPIAGVAVEPRYLSADEPTTPPTGSPTDQPTTKPEPPPAEPPTTDPTAAREPVRIDGASVTPGSRTLVVRYGDSSSCPHQNVTHAVKETADEVFVVLEADQMQPLVACTEDYRPVEVAVELQSPLGTRTLIDGSNGKPIAKD